jgi:hypothetical protein
VVKANSQWLIAGNTSYEPRTTGYELERINMTTRLDLRNLIRRRLGDLALPYHWSDLQLNQWLNDAIADYGLYFPRTLSLEIDAEAGVRAYELPADYQSAIRIEYPVGEETPCLLQRLSMNEQDFWELAGRYDILPRGDASTASELWLSDTPHDGEAIRIDYLADHASLDDDGDVTSVPDRHLELLLLFVRWASLQELASSEARNPNPGSLSLSALDANTLRAEATYRRQLAEALQRESASAVVSWAQEKIY